MADSAVLDAGLDLGVTPDTSTVETTPVETQAVETGTEDTQQPQDGAEGEQTAQPDKQTSQKSVFQENVSGDGKRAFTPEVKAALEKIKTTPELGGPVLAAQLRNALIQGQALREQIPGGVKEVRQMRQQLEQLEERGGFEKIDEHLGMFNGLQAAYEKAAPEFVADLAETNPDSFLQFCPQFMEKWLEMDPSGYSAQFGRVFTNDANQNGIPWHLKALEHSIPKDNPMAVEAFQGIKAYFDSRAALAKQPVYTKKESQQPDQKAHELTQREQQLTQKEWGLQETSQKQSIFRSVASELIGSRKITETENAEIMELFQMKMNQLERADPQYKARMERHRAAGDQSGFLKTARAFNEKAIKTALSSAISRVLKPATPGKPNVAPVANGKAAPKPAAVQNGHKWVASRPPVEQFAPETTTQMIREHKAILRDGSRVYWS